MVHHTTSHTCIPTLPNHTCLLSLLNFCILTSPIAIPTPPINSRSSYRQYSKVDVVEALYLLSVTDDVPIRSVALRYSIPPRTLSEFFNSMPLSLQFSPPSRQLKQAIEQWYSQKPKAGNPSLFHLKQEEECLLVEWIKKMSEFGMSVPQRIIGMKVQEIVKHRADEQSRAVALSHRFWKAFYKRHPELTQREGRWRDEARVKGATMEKIHHFYDELQQVMHIHPNLSPSQLCTADETGIVTEKWSTQVVAPRQQQYVVAIDYGFDYIYHCCIFVMPVVCRLIRICALKGKQFPRIFLMK